VEIPVRFSDFLKGLPTSEILATVAAIVSVGSIAVVGFSFIEDTRYTRDQQADLLRSIQMQIDSTNKDFRTTRSQLQELTARIDAFANPSPESANAVAIASMAAKLETFETKLSAVEAAFTDNIEKALSLPLLRKDVQQLDERFQISRTELTSQVDRVYDLFKWFIPALAGLAISIFATTFKK
jgi:hypothetical protein